MAAPAPAYPGRARAMGPQFGGGVGNRVILILRDGGLASGCSVKLIVCLCWTRKHEPKDRGRARADADDGNAKRTESPSAGCGRRASLASFCAGPRPMPAAALPKTRNQKKKGLRAGSVACPLNALTSIYAPMSA